MYSQASQPDKKNGFGTWVCVVGKGTENKKNEGKTKG